MNVIISNNSTKEVYTENYDKVIYLGHTPSRKLKENELVLLQDMYCEYNDTIISINGLNKYKQHVSSKKELQKSYLLKKNQIVSNDRGSNFTQIMETGEEINFVGIGNHLEIKL